jgi:hypothetical protein
MDSGGGAWTCDRPSSQRFQRRSRPGLPGASVSGDDANSGRWPDPRAAGHGEEKGKEQDGGPTERAERAREAGAARGDTAHGIAR